MCYHYQFNRFNFIWPLYHKFVILHIILLNPNLLIRGRLEVLPSAIWIIMYHVFTASIWTSGGDCIYMTATSSCLRCLFSLDYLRFAEYDCGNWNRCVHGSYIIQDWHSSWGRGKTDLRVKAQFNYDYHLLAGKANLNVPTRCSHAHICESRQEIIFLVTHLQQLMCC